MHPLVDKSGAIAKQHEGILNRYRSESDCASFAAVADEGGLYGHDDVRDQAARFTKQKQSR